MDRLHKQGVMILLAVVLFLLSSMLVSAFVVDPTGLNISIPSLSNRPIAGSFVNGTAYVLHVNVNTTQVNGTTNITFYFNHSNGSAPTLVLTLSGGGAPGFGNGTNNATYNATFNSSILVDGIYSVHVNLTNNSGDIFETSTSPLNVNVTVDNNAPTIVANMTRGGNSSFQNYSLKLNFTAQDVSMNMTCMYLVDGTTNASNMTKILVPAGNFSVTQSNISYNMNFSEGLHNWTVNCTDETNHNSSLGINYFYVSLTPPLVEMFAPTNLSSRERYVNATFNVTWRAIDNVSPSMNCSVVLNRTSAQPFHNITVVSLNNTNYSRQLTLGDNVTFNISVNCTTGSIINNQSIINSTVYPAASNNTNENFTTNAGAPLVTLVSPANVTRLEDGNFSFICNASDSRLANVTLFHTLANALPVGTVQANASNASNGSVRTDNQFNFSVVDLGVGVTLIWNCNATDTGGNTAFASENFTIARPAWIRSLNLSRSRNDNTAFNGSFANGSAQVLHVNVNTSSINSTKNITFYFNHSNGSVILVATLNASDTGGNNIGSNNVTYNLTFNTSTLVDGIYVVTVNLTNTSGNVTSVANANVTVDNNAPTVVLNITRGNGSFQNYSLNLNFTALDVSQNLTCTLVVDGPGNSSNMSRVQIPTGNFSLEQGNVSFRTVNFSAGNIVEGIHNYTVNCSDETNHNSTSGYSYFYVSTTPPLVEVFAPINRTGRENYINGTFNITWRAIDNVSPSMNCSVVLNQTGAQPFHNITVVSLNNTNYTRELRLGDNVTFNISVNCTTGSIINNQTIINSTVYPGTRNTTNGNFTTNINAPLVTLISPSDATTNTSSDLTFVCNASDSRLANVTLFHNINDAGITFVLNETNASNGTVRTDNQFTYNMTNLKTGFTLIWNCNATDTAGNTVFASTNFTIGRPRDAGSAGGGGGGGGGASAGSGAAAGASSGAGASAGAGASSGEGGASAGGESGGSSGAGSGGSSGGSEGGGSSGAGAASGEGSAGTGVSGSRAGDSGGFATGKAFQFKQFMNTIKLKPSIIVFPAVLVLALLGGIVIYYRRTKNRQ